MCLSDLVRLEHVDPSGAVGSGRAGDRSVEVSLAVLALDGVEVAPGDWVVVHTGLAVERIPPEVAADALAARADLEDHR